MRPVVFYNLSYNDYYGIIYHILYFFVPEASLICYLEKLLTILCQITNYVYSK